MMRWITITIVGWAAVAVVSAATQEERFRGREVLDAESNAWVPAAEGVVSGPLARARLLLADGDADAARKLLKDWVAENRAADDYYEGVLLLGEAHFADGDYWKAAEQFEAVSENTSGTLFFRAVERTIDVARAFLAGEKRIVWGFLPLPARDEGVALLDRAWERVPGTPLGELALKLKADYFFERGEMANAQQEYALLAREYPDGRYVRFAMLRAAEAAEAQFPSIRHDDRPLIEARELYRAVGERFPEYADREAVPERLEGIRRARAAKKLEIADWYVRADQPQAAAFYYRLVRREYPDTQAAFDARTALRRLGFELESSED